MSSTVSGNRLIAPVLMGFFIMGFCDMVAPITRIIRAESAPDLQVWVDFLPSMVFLWFLLLSVPTASLMNRIGRKATALVGYGLTVAGLLIPFLAGRGCGLEWYFVGFGLLGIGNTAIQVAVNPLLATIVPSERMTSYLTVGQVFRNTSLLLLAPIVTAFVAWTGNWRLLLPVYALLTLAGGIWLGATPVAETRSTAASAGFADCFRLFGNRTVAIAAVGIACFIATDVGIGFLSSQLIDNPDSILTTTAFYGCRIAGTLLGAYLLLRVRETLYLRLNMVLALVLCICLLVFRSEAAIYALYGLLGFALACVFSTLYAVATQAVPQRANQVAGLMILMISAGAISAPVIGAIIRAAGEARYGMLFVIPCVAYLLWASCYVKTRKKPQK